MDKHKIIYNNLKQYRGKQRLSFKVPYLYQFINNLQKLLKKIKRMRFILLRKWSNRYLKRFILHNFLNKFIKRNQFNNLQSNTCLLHLYYYQAIYTTIETITLPMIDKRSKSMSHKKLNRPQIPAKIVNFTLNFPLIFNKQSSH